MFLVDREHRVYCANHKEGKVFAKTKKQYLEDLYCDDPEYFFEPWDSDDLHLYVCPKCKQEDFISDYDHDWFSDGEQK